MDGKILITLFVLLVILLFLSVTTAIYYLARVIGEIDPKKNTLANIVPWAVPFSPGLLTKAGKRYQMRFISFLLIGALSVGGLFIIDNILRSKSKSDDITNVSNTN